MRRLERAEIIAVGTELLLPHRAETNSLYLAGQLAAAGIELVGKGIVGDDHGRLVSRLREALGRADLVILTGGLGPTEDDLTRQAIAEVMDAPLEEDPSLADELRERFRRLGQPMVAINLRQALVPRGATPLPNRNGTAPGLLLESGARMVLALPGPPRELQPMFAAHVRDRLRAAGAGDPRQRRIVRVTGLPESTVEDRVRDLDDGLRAGPVVVDRSILAGPGRIELHFSAKGPDAAQVTRELDAAVSGAVARLGRHVVSTDGRELHEVVGDRLRTRGWRLAAAESCTGGLLLGRLTEVPGSSAWVVGGVVAYDNGVKIAELGVPAAMLAEHGAVSEPVARAMADGVRTRLAADIGVAITGVAGPGGGTDAKPVGTVAIAVSGPQASCRTFHFPGDRAAVRERSVCAALDLVRRAID